MNKLVLTLIISLSFFIVHEAKAQGCGDYTASGTAECLDYKGRSIDLSVCNTHTAEIGAQPTIPTATCPNTCDANNCALPPSCSTGMNSIITGTDSNSCNTFLCVSETCAPQPSCPSGTASYTGLDSNNCPEWLCSVTIPAKPKVKCQPAPKCDPKTQTIRVSANRDSNGCRVFHGCGTKTCKERPKCSSGKQLRYTGKNPSTGCQVYKCFSPCPKIHNCTNGTRVDYGAASASNNYCPVYICRESSPGTGTGTGSTTTSCPSTPNCGSGKTLKNNGKNSAGCTKWTCVAKSCPKAPGCSGGQTLKTTGKDSNGCTTYQCTN